jgi:hypothetical protein
MTSTDWEVHGIEVAGGAVASHGLVGHCPDTSRHVVVCIVLDMADRVLLGCSGFEGRDCVQDGEPVVVLAPVPLVS